MYFFDGFIYLLLIALLVIVLLILIMLGVAFMKQAHEALEDCPPDFIGDWIRTTITWWCEKYEAKKRR